jgi:beta-phosphoglucomutase-like phosphatase (HAD superfamily)
MTLEERGAALGIEDSGAGVVSIRLAGLQAWGIAGGNIEASGTERLCSRYSADFEEIWRGIQERGG